jgi:hypothetical protein
MKSNVFLVITRIVVLFAAVCTFVQSFTSMNAQMSLVVAVVLVVLSAKTANKRSFTFDKRNNSFKMNYILNQS